MSAGSRYKALGAAGALTFWVLVGSVLSFASQANDGLKPGGQDSAWPRWQGRVSIEAPPNFYQRSTDTAPATALSLALLGDYYMRTDSSGGFRATSGLLVGPRSRSMLTLSAPADGSALKVERRSAHEPWRIGMTESDSSAIPYVGLGYSGSVRRFGGLRFSADIGVTAINPSGVKLGPLLGGSQGLDDAVRELRLAPLVQVGASYSF
jgi:hypothetical protein